VLIPLLLFFDPDLPRRLGGEVAVGPEVAAYTVWHNVVRPLAVGAMLVAASYTLYSMRRSLSRSLAGLLRIPGSATVRQSLPRTERDLSPRWIVGGVTVSSAAVAGIYYHFTGGLGSAVTAALVMCLAGFFLSAVGAYLVGLVGSSNQPVSGLTLAALVIAALTMVALGLRGPAGVAAVLGVAAVVCCACCVAGSLAQDLKAGHVLGGTPWKMQVAEIAAVVLLAFFLMAPIIVLDEANRQSGGIGGLELPAPQAGLMAQLAQGIVSGEMPWGLLAIGVAFGLALILAGVRSPMLVAVGMYLPFKTVAAILVGGLVRAIGDRLAAARGRQAEAEQRGLLVASGLIAGEAVTGILLAASALDPRIPSLMRLLIGSDEIPALAPLTGWFSAATFLLLAWLLARLPASQRAA